MNIQTRSIAKIMIFVSFIFLNAFFFSSEAFSAETAPVELNHWSYDIVNKFAAAGYIRGYALNTRPYNRSDFVSMILAMDSSMAAGLSVNAKDKVLLDKLKAEFEFDMNDRGYWPDLSRRQSHLLSWSGGDYGWVLDPSLKAAGFQTYSRTPDTHWFTNTSTWGIASYGYFRDDIDFYFYARDTRISRLEEFNTLDEINLDNEGITAVTWDGNSASFDRTYASLSTRLKWFDVRIGRNKLDWGPSNEGGLLLSDYALPFDMVMLQYPGRRVRATFVAGSLRTDLIDSTISYQTPANYRKNFKKKYIATHRFELLPWKNLTIGLSETAIYGERGFDLGYMIPVMFFWSEQHYLGDRDNLLISFDAAYYPRNGYKLYGALLLDDISLNKFGSDHWGNKWAIQVGAENVDPLGIKGLSLTAEYVRIEPYVYTHFFAVNTYANHDQFLGFPMQPNSDKFMFKADYWINPLSRLKARFERMRHGANPPGENVGGDILLGHRNEDPLTKKFLAGIGDRSWGVNFGGSYEFFPEAFCSFEARFQQDDYAGQLSKQLRLLASISYRYY